MYQKVRHLKITASHHHDVFIDSAVKGLSLEKISYYVHGLLSEKQNTFESQWTCDNSKWSLLEKVSCPLFSVMQNTFLNWACLEQLCPRDSQQIRCRVHLALSDGGWLIRLPLWRWKSHRKAFEILKGPLAFVDDEEGLTWMSLRRFHTQTVQRSSVQVRVGSALKGFIIRVRIQLHVVLDNDDLIKSESEFLHWCSVSQIIIKEQEVDAIYSCKWQNWTLMRNVQHLYTWKLSWLFFPCPDLHGPSELVVFDASGTVEGVMCRGLFECP